MKSVYFSFRLFLITAILLFNITLVNCNSDEGIVASAGDVSETRFGKVTKVDDYPLFTLNYTADYEFDKYLQTGDYPGSTSRTKQDSFFICTCFAAFGSGSRIVGSN